MARKNVLLQRLIDQYGHVDNFLSVLPNLKRVMVVRACTLFVFVFVFFFFFFSASSLFA
jgi:hypothetical protein